MMEAFLLINCDFGKEKQVVDQLSPLSEVKEARAIIGIYDIIVKLESNTKKNLDHVIKSKILKINPINSVLILESECSFKFNKCEQTLKADQYLTMKGECKQECQKGRCWFCLTSCDPQSYVHEDCILVMSELFQSQSAG